MGYMDDLVQMGVNAQLEGLNVDKKTISLIENGKRGFQDYEILCFARALGVPASYILEGIPEA